MDEMTVNRIEELLADIASYEQAIENAEDAIEAAERELCEELNVRLL